MLHATLLSFSSATSQRFAKQCRRTLLGERIMWQRMQMAVSIVLLAAVALLAAQLYSGQRANEAALADITSTLKQLTQHSATGDAPAAGQSSSHLAQNNWSAERPTVVETIPKNGDSEVDPA